MFNILKNRLQILVSLFLLLCSISCDQVKNKPRLLLDKFIYSAYIWKWDDTASNFEFYLAQYLDVDKNGVCRIMRRDTFNHFPEFIKTKLSDQLIHEINALFITKTYRENYPNDSETINIDVYDGFTYNIEYSLQKTSRRMIQCIPDFAPMEIQNLMAQLDSVILKSSSDSTTQFDLTGFIDSMKVYSLKMPGLPPAPKTIKFIPPRLAR